MIQTLRMLAAALALLAAAAATAQDYDLSWYTIDGGGGMWSAGGDFELSGTTGQPDAGATMTGGDFALTGGFWPGIAAGPAPCPGDYNCDGQINFDDIDPFVIALSTQACCDGTGANCDVNGDGSITFDDIDPFIVLLSSGASCP